MQQQQHNMTYNHSPHIQQQKEPSLTLQTHFPRLPQPHNTHRNGKQHPTKP